MATDSVSSLINTAAANSLVRSGDLNFAQAATGLVDPTGVASLFLTAAGALVNAANTAVFLTTIVPQTLTGAGAVNLTTLVTLLVTTGANALTLAAGTTGQIKFIGMKTDGGDGTLTPNALVGGTTLTFNDADDWAVLCYTGAAWGIVVNKGCTLA